MKTHTTFYNLKLARHKKELHIKVVDYMVVMSPGTARAEGFTARLRNEN